MKYTEEDYLADKLAGRLHTWQFSNFGPPEIRNSAPAWRYIGFPSKSIVFRKTCYWQGKEVEVLHRPETYTEWLERKQRETK